MQEEKEILAHIEKHSTDKSQEKENEKKDLRLGEIYEQLQSMNASASESKARKILFGLGFNKEMQIRPTKYFSGNSSFLLLPPLPLTHIEDRHRHTHMHILARSKKIST